MGDHTLGLFDQYPAVESVLQLGALGVALAQGTFLQDADRRDIRQRLGDIDIPLGSSISLLRSSVEATASRSPCESTSRMPASDAPSNAAEFSANVLSISTTL
ncbi:hypothetical protein [Leifsonia sp. A12D58]|uniref:hypothetical protein n=1 Tax=Leifsonia sp. A12D58 TaxID=3397674 RepID=UPI0039E176B0